MATNWLKLEIHIALEKVTGILQANGADAELATYLKEKVNEAFVEIEKQKAYILSLEELIADDRGDIGDDYAPSYLLSLPN